MREIRRALIGILIAGVILALSLALLAHRNREARRTAALRQAALARHDAAAKAFRVVWAAYERSATEGDRVYHASLRLRAAECDLSDRRADRVQAARAHLDRMIRLLEREQKEQFVLHTPGNLDGTGPILSPRGGILVGQGQA